MPANKNPSRCSKCKKTFSRKSSLTRHLKKMKCEKKAVLLRKARSTKKKNATNRLYYHRKRARDRGEPEPTIVENPPATRPSRPRPGTTFVPAPIVVHVHMTFHQLPVPAS